MTNAQEHSTSGIGSRLVLGTAQLGLPYGIANKSGQPAADLAFDIVMKSWNLGVREYDTAQAYGTSEEVLGRVFRQGEMAENVRVISKVDPAVDHRNPKKLRASVRGTLDRIGVKSLYGLMIHEEEYLELWNEGLGKTLLEFIREGLVLHIGVSVYSPKRALQALSLAGVNIVQLPANILDQRFADAGVFDIAEKKCKNVYIRSPFLQGLLLMEPMDIPERLSFARPYVGTYIDLVKKYGLTPQIGALGYLKARFPNTRIVFGAETVEQVVANCSAWETVVPSEFVTDVSRMFRDVEERVVNPSLWPCE